MLHLCAEDFRIRALKQRGALGDVTGDHLLNPSIVAHLHSLKFQDAAVLIGLRPHDAGARIILTQRAAHLRKHGGQVAFPGGVIDTDDASVEAAALREAQEEIGLDPRFVEPLCVLPDYLTATGFRIKPVVAIVSVEASFVLNHEEVDALFEVPLPFLMDRANFNRESRIFNGIERHYYALPYEDRLIWGVTAGIIRVMQEIFYT